MIRKILKFFGYSFAAMVVAMLLIGMFGEREPVAKPKAKEWYERDDSAVALGRAQRAVKDYLKSPASAKVPGYAEAQGHVKALPGQKYLINSWIDAQNSFGAMLRTNYKAAVIQKEKDVWEITELQIE